MKTGNRKLVPSLAELRRLPDAAFRPAPYTPPMYAILSSLRRTAPAACQRTVLTVLTMRTVLTVPIAAESLRATGTAAVAP